MNTGDSELGKLQSKQRERVARSINRGRDGPNSSAVHPDLEELEFGDIGSTNSSLPPPITPSTLDSPTERSRERGSLSDFSDYDSSDEGLYERPSSSHGVRKYRTELSEEEDPFADPFADQEDSVSTPGARKRADLSWH